MSYTDNPSYNINSVFKEAKERLCGVYPVINSKMADKKFVYGLKIVAFMPKNGESECSFIDECIIPLQFDADESECFITRQMIKDVTLDGSHTQFKPMKNYVPYDDKKDWNYISGNVNRPSLKIRRIRKGFNYIFRVGGFCPDVNTASSFNDPDIKKRKNMFDVASRVVCKRDGTYRYMFYNNWDDGNENIGFSIGPKDSFYLYQYHRCDPKNIDRGFNPYNVVLYSEPTQYGLGKKYIKFQITELGII